MIRARNYKPLLAVIVEKFGDRFFFISLRQGRLFSSSCFFQAQTAFLLLTLPRHFAALRPKHRTAHQLRLSSSSGLLCQWFARLDDNCFATISFPFLFPSSQRGCASSARTATRPRTPTSPLTRLSTLLSLPLPLPLHLPLPRVPRRRRARWPSPRCRQLPTRHRAPLCRLLQAPPSARLLVRPPPPLGVHRGGVRRRRRRCLARRHVRLVPAQALVPAPSRRRVVCCRSVRRRRIRIAPPRRVTVRQA